MLKTSSLTSECPVLWVIAHPSLAIEAQAFLASRSEEEEVQENVADAGKTGQEKKGYVGIHATGFKELMLKPELLQAITDCGFEHPSEGPFFASRDFLFFSLANLVVAACSSARVHSPRDPWHGRPLPSKIRNGQDCCVCAFDPAAAGS